MNVSFQNENIYNNLLNIFEKIPKNPYITKDHVPILEILDKNAIICDGIEFNIKDYIKKINNASDEFLDDLEIYNHWGKCKNDLNKYFFKICKENICNKCYANCEWEKHDFIDLNETKEESNFFC